MLLPKTVASEWGDRKKRLATVLAVLCGVIAEDDADPPPAEI
jgi:hypothetical protein